jgi:iron(III) transport system substrate-binding protein
MKPKVATLMLAMGALVLAGCGSPSQATNDASKAWQESAQLGAFSAAKQDWAAIEAGAKKEGSVTVYSVSSRMQKFGKSFEGKYGVKVSFVELASNDQTERFQREYKAGIRDVDVLYNNDSATMVESFLPKGLIHNFVPDTVKDELDPSETEPILNQRWTGRVFLYNSHANPGGAPIDTLWDLTRPEWKAKFQMPDPSTDGAQAEIIMTLLQHPEEMASAYEKEFGKPLVEYSKAVKDATAGNRAYSEPNAAIEWLHQMLENEPVFVESTTDISSQVGNVNDPSPPMGSATYSKIRDVKKGVLEWLPAFNVAPAVGVFYPNVLAVADQAPHPNAAKLVIREMMGAEGFEPWNEPGDYATSKSIQKAQVEKYGDIMPPFSELKKFVVDSKYQQSHRSGFLQLYLSL